MKQVHQFELVRNLDLLSMLQVQEENAKTTNYFINYLSGKWLLRSKKVMFVMSPIENQ